MPNFGTLYKAVRMARQERFGNAEHALICLAGFTSLVEHSKGPRSAVAGY